MRRSGVEAAMQELEREVNKIQVVIEALKRIRAEDPGARVRVGKRRLSPEGRRRISEAAKQRWAAQRASKKKQHPTKKAMKG